MINPRFDPMPEWKDVTPKTALSWEAWRLKIGDHDAAFVMARPVDDEPNDYEWSINSAWGRAATLDKAKVAAQNALIEYAHSVLEFLGQTEAK